MDSAKLALREITEQGEGSVHPTPPTPYAEPFGSYDDYGQRIDGTYGPILGTPWELSHYRKFEQLATGEVPVPAVYPIVPNLPGDSLNRFTQGLSDRFDTCYTLTLRSLENTFSSSEPAPFSGSPFH